MTLNKTACIFLIITAGLTAYANSFSNKFVWDDVHLVEHNKHIESFSYVKDILREDLCYMLEEPTGYYRPIQALSYAVDYFLWGRDPIGYHITSFIIQIMNAVLIFHLCLLILGEKWKSCFIATLFCVHPAFVPVVGYVSGRADLLGLFFALVAIYIVIKCSIRRERRHLLWLAVLCFALAILSKEYYMIAPLIITLYLAIFRDDLEKERSMTPVLFSMLLVLMAYILLRLTILNFHQKMGGMSNFPFSVRAAIFPYILTNYIFTIVFPFNLAMEKKLIYTSLFESRLVLSYVTPLSTIFLIHFFYKTKQKLKLFFLGWFIIAILPVSNLLIPLKVFSADHWTYMASIGLIGLLVLVTEDIFRRFRVQFFFGRVKIALVVLLVGLFAFLTIRESRYWRDDEMLFARIFEKSPHQSRALFNMGKVYKDKGDYKKALELYEMAIKESSGKDAYIFNGRALLYRKTGDLKKAQKDLQEAVRIEPSVAHYHNNLGGIYAELGMVDKARAEWEKTLRIDPGNELARKNLEFISQN